MRESPRIRRLRSDLRGLEQLRDESTIFDFVVPGPLHLGLPEGYIVRYRGPGLWREPNSEDVVLRQEHEVGIALGATYPRMMPELSWRTPIFHPNISGSGVVCLGGYGTHWAPSLSLAELCNMLWDMIRYQNFDEESPYNREAAYWAKHQKELALPLDPRPLRDRVGLTGADENEPRRPPIAAPPRPELLRRDEEIVDAQLVDAELVDAEPDDAEQPEIIFLDS